MSISKHFVRSNPLCELFPTIVIYIPSAYIPSTYLPWTNVPHGEKVVVMKQTPEVVIKNLGKRLRELRNKTGLSQEAFADMLDWIELASAE
ncbi:MAG: helix-turn-helix domain-containing protein [Candidatus Melainabacteria bacterium]|nr:helix-turn-helix domain-containing protein [Candidatus Melainabacteria bacterium]